MLPFNRIKDKINLNFDLKTDVNIATFTQHAKKIYNAQSTKEIFKEFNFNFEPLQQYIVQTYFDPIAFQNDATLVKNTLYTREAKDQNYQLKTAVQNQLILTKHRIVFVDNIQGFQTTNGVLVEQPYSFALTTACAPNAMNPDSVDIPVYFSKEQFKAGLLFYREMMELTYRRCIEIQKANNIDVLIIPPLGLGVYLKTLTDDQKQAVISINYQALASTCLKIDKGSLKQIICTVPNHNSNNICRPHAQFAFIGYRGNIPVEITNTDALETAQLLAEKYYKVSVIIPGSFSTVGGAYKILPHNGKLQPKEESDYQATNAAQVIPIDTNEGSTRYEYYHFTGDLVCKNEALYKNTIAPTHPSFANYNPKPSITTNEIKKYLYVNGVQINNDIVIKNILDPNSGKFNTGIYFKKKDDAVRFVTLLTNNRITGRHGPKYIHSGNYIILTHTDIEKIKNSLIINHEIKPYTVNSESAITNFSNDKLTNEQIIAELNKINNNFLAMTPENKNSLLLFTPWWSDEQIELIKSEKAKYYQLLIDYLKRHDIDNQAKVSLLTEVTTQKNIIDCHIDKIHIGETTTRKNLEDMIEKLNISLDQDKDLNKTQLSIHRKAG